jgi:hypothetical protein
MSFNAIVHPYCWVKEVPEDKIKAFDNFITKRECVVFYSKLVKAVEKYHSSLTNYSKNDLKKMKNVKELWYFSTALTSLE